MDLLNNLALGFGVAFTVGAFNGGYLYPFAHHA